MLETILLYIVLALFVSALVALGFGKFASIQKHKDDDMWSEYRRTTRRKK